MKANQKFLKGDDEAVSPVIAVILMVAITVVLAATVYVWVSGFGGGGQASKSMALASSGALSGGNTKIYTVTSATQGMKWSDISITLDGAPLTYTGPLAGNDQFCVATSGSTCVVTASWDASTTIVTAGQQLSIRDASLSGQTLRILDSQANSVILTLVVG